MSNNNPYENQNYNNYNDYDEPYMESGANLLDLNSILVKSFIFMFIALVVTGAVAMYIGSDINLVVGFIGGPQIFVVIVLEMVAVFVTNYAVRNEVLPLALIGFFGYSVFTGITFSVLFVAYDLGSIANAFIVTAVVFMLMAVYGLITKRDMDSMSDYAFMALLGIIVTSVLNILVFRSSSLDWLISAIGVVLFTILTALDVQKIKNMYTTDNGKSNLVIAIYGAMQLYLDFINLFLKLLRLMGKAKK